MTEDCKCIEFGGLTENFFIANKQGWAQACAIQNGDSLKWGFIVDNDACDPFLPFIYDGAKSFNFGLAPVKVKGKWGVIDSTGKRAIDYQYKELQSFSDSVAAFLNDNGLWGFINTKGDTVLNANFTEVNSFWGNLTFAFHPTTGWKVYNSKGKMMPIQIDSLIDDFHIDNRMLAISHGRLYDRTVYNEVIEYPFYSKNKKVKLVGFRNRYAVLPYTMNTNLRAIEKSLTTDKLMPIFE